MKVFIVGLNENAVSESFIRAHCQLLACRPLYHQVHRDRIKPGDNERQRIDENLLVRGLRKAKKIIGIKQPPQVYGYLSRQKPGLIVAEYGITGGILLPYCKQLGIPMVTIFHGYEISVHSIVESHAGMYKDLMDYCTATVAVSKPMAQKLSALGGAPEKIVWTPCAPADVFYSIQPDYSSLYFYTVGRFVEKKGPQITLLAFARLLGSEPQAKLLMVGDGPLLGACKWLAKGLGISHAVSFTGALPQPQVFEKIKGAFCFLQHSVTATNGDSEGTPVAVLEAGAAGMPLVATRHAGIPDVVIERQTGLLVDEGDVEGMAAAMLTLFRDRALCQSMGAAARAHVRHNFSMDKHIGILNALVEKAVAGVAPN